MKRFLLPTIISCLGIFLPIGCLLPSSNAIESSALIIMEDLLNGVPLACLLELANSIDNPSLKAIHLAKVAKRYIESGQENKGLEILEQAIQFGTMAENSKAIPIATKLIPSPWYTSPWLNIGDAYVAAGRYDRAFQIARKQGITDLSSLLKIIIDNLLKNNEYDKALQVANRLENAKDKSINLIQIAFYYIEKNPSKAREIIQQIEEIGGNLYVLEDLARLYVQMGQYPKVLEVANTIEDIAAKDRIFWFVASKSAKAKQFDRAIQIANFIQNTDNKNNVLGEIAVQYAKAGEKEKANQIFSSILEYIDTLKNAPDIINPPNIISFQDPSPLVRSLVRIAIQYAEAGFYDRAVEIANSIQKVDKKADTLRSIALIATEAGDYDRAIDVANGIRETEEKDTTSKSSVLSEIVQRIASKRLPDRALLIADTIKDISAKDMALHYVTISYAELRQYDRAYQLANSIKNPEIKQVPFFLISKGYARLGQYEKAFQVADSTQDAGLRESALTAIAISYAEVRQIDKAIEIFNTIKIISRRIQTLSSIAGGFIEIGQYEQGLQFLKTIVTESYEEKASINFNRDQIEISMKLTNCVKRR